MSESVLVAIVAAVPPTIAALTAIWQVHRLSRPINDVNRAVNHRVAGQKTLIETVDYIATEVADLRRVVHAHKHSLDRHLAFHQRELEDDALEE